ncbi:MAG: orotidine-5'-phosphate decarboxylase [Sulfuricaulis sp.]|uniref:orotidine-5'-phosphate decarboxylase n=1 Tax=Sulfuricaulis sp. TaxID=2003553 RepID=UPI003C53CEF7
MENPRVIVALDFPDAHTAQTFAERLLPAHCRLKVGMELFTAAGPKVVENLVSRGFDVFLDLKYHDIPTTVARACTQAASLGVWMLNVHVLGGKKMLLAAREAVDRLARRPLLIGVTLLTSHSADDVADLGWERDGVARHVERLAGLAELVGLDGVVCSPQETVQLRRRFGKDFLLVTPGVRPTGVATDDQSRTRTPADAVADGSDYLVIGRPITRAADPVAALAAINREIQA